MGTQAERERRIASVLTATEREQLHRLLRRLMQAFPDRDKWYNPAADGEKGDGAAEGRQTGGRDRRQSSPQKSSRRVRSSSGAGSAGGAESSTGMASTACRSTGSEPTILGNASSAATVKHA